MPYHSNLNMLHVHAFHYLTHINSKPCSEIKSKNIDKLDVCMCVLCLCSQKEEKMNKCTHNNKNNEQKRKDYKEKHIYNIYTINHASNMCKSCLVVSSSSGRRICCSTVVLKKSRILLFLPFFPLESRIFQVSYILCYLLSYCHLFTYDVVVRSLLQILLIAPL